MTPDPLHWMYASAALMMWLGLLGWTMLRTRRIGAMQIAGSPLLIGYASQSGHARDLALATAQALSSDAKPLQAVPLDLIGPETLTAASRALFILSTTGQGDAPDHAAGFASRITQAPVALDHLEYGLLALGDRTYPDFCGFGRMMDSRLEECGAKAIFPRIEMDRGEPEAFARWLQDVGHGFGRELAPVMSQKPYDLWRLAGREHLNAGSPGGKLFHLFLTPHGSLPDWRPGDIATIDIPLPDGGSVARDYSVASIPSDGQVELIVRQVRDGAGRYGCGSGWLTRQLQQGQQIQMRIRENPGFHSPDMDHPMILIGSGSGLAGLIGHIRHRARMANAGPVWMIYGERCPKHDAILPLQFQDWQQSGILQRLDRSFSRDLSSGGPRYVQDVIRNHAQILSDWVKAGAAIYICGRQEGMAQDVQSALSDGLGQAQVQNLIRSGRLRRDVY